MSGYRVTRIRRTALPVGVELMLSQAKVGDRVHLTFYGVPSDAVIAWLDSQWVEFREDPTS
jgi:hypothetical protein